MSDGADILRLHLGPGWSVSEEGFGEVCVCAPDFQKDRVRLPRWTTLGTRLPPDHDEQLAKELQKFAGELKQRYRNRLRVTVAEARVLVDLENGRRE